MPEKIELCCSGNIIKNVKGVKVPNSNGLKGIDVAATLGVVGGRADRELEVLEDVTEADIEKTKELVQQGHFIEFLGSCIYDGIWVGEDSEIPNYHGIRKDLVDAFQKLHPPVIRWPGGCYADVYHWRNGIGPRENRPVTYNENFGTFSSSLHPLITSYHCFSSNFFSV